MNWLLLRHTELCCPEWLAEICFSKFKRYAVKELHHLGRGEHKAKWTTFSALLQECCRMNKIAQMKSYTSSHQMSIWLLWTLIEAHLLNVKGAALVSDAWHKPQSLMAKFLHDCNEWGAEMECYGGLLIRLLFVFLGPKLKPSWFSRVHEPCYLSFRKLRNQSYSLFGFNIIINCFQINVKTITIKDEILWGVIYIISFLYSTWWKWHGLLRPPKNIWLCLH